MRVSFVTQVWGKGTFYLAFWSFLVWAEEIQEVPALWGGKKVSEAPWSLLSWPSPYLPAVGGEAGFVWQAHFLNLGQFETYLNCIGQGCVETPTAFGLWLELRSLQLLGFFILNFFLFFNIFLFWPKQTVIHLQGNPLPPQNRFWVGGWGA